MRKRLFCCITVLILLLATAGSALATEVARMEPPDNSPRYEHILLVGGSIDINNKKAEMTGYVNAQPGKATSVKVILTLQKLNSFNDWEDIVSWDASQTGLNAGLTSGYYVLSNSLYRAQITGIAYVNGVAVESVTAATDPMWS